MRLVINRQNQNLSTKATTYLSQNIYLSWTTLFCFLKWNVTSCGSKRAGFAERLLIARWQPCQRAKTLQNQWNPAFLLTVCYVPFLFINLYNLLSKCCWLFNPLKFLFNSCSLKIVIDGWKLSADETAFKCKVQFLF